MAALINIMSNFLWEKVNGDIKICMTGIKFILTLVHIV